LGCKLVGVGQKNNKTVAANGFKRAMVDGLSLFNHKAPPGGKSDKKTEEKTRWLSRWRREFYCPLAFWTAVPGPVFMPGHGARRALSELAIQTIISPGPRLSSVVKFVA
jgi:hypothetical protein